MAAQASSSAADVEWKPNASFLAACESLGLDEPAISDGEVKYDAQTDTVYAPTREAVAEFRGQPKDDGAPRGPLRIRQKEAAAGHVAAQPQQAHHNGSGLTSAGREACARGGASGARAVVPRLHLPERRHAPPRAEA